MKKIWEFYKKDNEVIDNIANKFEVSKMLATVLANRGLKDEEELKIFLEPARNNFYDPFLMPDMQIGVQRILKAIENKERIIIYGDYDADGITSVVVLKRFFKVLGVEANYFIPNRLEEGYGLNEDAISQIAKTRI